MNLIESLKHSNPITPAAKRTWERDHQHQVWEHLLEQLNDNVVVVEPAVESIQSHRRPRALAAAAAVLIIGAAAIALQPQGVDRVEFISTAAAVEALPPLELATDGYIWLSPDVPGVAEAALAFNDQALGWPDPDPVARTSDPGPTWVDLNFNKETIALLFAPDDETATRWRLLQVGTNPDMSRVSNFANRSEVTLGAIPPGTESIAVLASSDTGTTRTQVTDITKTSTVTVEGAARSVLTLYFDANGALLDARGSHA